MHSYVHWISHVVIYKWLFTRMLDVSCCCNLMMFCDWRECTSALGTAKKQKQNKQKTFLVQLYRHLAKQLCCIVLRDVRRESGTTGTRRGWRACRELGELFIPGSQTPFAALAKGKVRWWRPRLPPKPVWAWPLEKALLPLSKFIITTTTIDLYSVASRRSVTYPSS